MKSKLKWDISEYTPHSLRAFSEAEVRKEYSRLRTIANSRLERMGDSEFRDTQIYKINAGKYPTISNFEKPSDIYYKLSELADFINAKTSTITGLKHQRSEAIKSLHEHGYDFVNKENFNEFTKFMDDYRTRKLNQTYSSERVAQAFNTAENIGVPPEELAKNFRFFMREMELIDKADTRAEREQAAAELRERLETKQRKQRAKNLNKLEQEKKTKRRGKARR